MLVIGIFISGFDSPSDSHTSPDASEISGTVYIYPPSGTVE